MLCRDNAHDLVAELPEQGSLEGFCHKIGDHVAGWAPLDCEFPLLDAIRYKIVADVDVLRAFAARGFAVPL